MLLNAKPKHGFLSGILIAAVLFCAHTIAQQTAMPNNEQTSIYDTSAIETMLNSSGIPGMTYAVLSQCTVTQTGVAGYAIVEDETKVKPNTVFEAASLSKPVFAWLVLSLAEDKIIDINQSFHQAGFSYPRIIDKEKYALLTPKLVLSHRTAGLPNWSTGSGDGLNNDTLSFVFEPETIHSYSGEAYYLLQLFIEAKTGLSLNELFQRRLGFIMPNSSFKRPLTVTKNESRGYYVDDNKESVLVASFGRESAAYSLITTATDFANFLSLVCQKQRLSEQSYALMLNSQTDSLPQSDNPISWSLGWQMLTIGDRDSVFHTGDNGNYQAMAMFFKETGNGYVVLTNAENGLSFINQFLRRAELER